MPDSHDHAPVVVVTGLAAAGKTTLAAPLAEALHVPLVSKDAIMEALHEALRVAADKRWREVLSRAADAVLVEIAAGVEGGVVLDNFWRRETAADLLASIGSPLVEVYCRVDPDIALARWNRRSRHAVHVDERLKQDPEEAFRAVTGRAQRLPIGYLGPVIEVDTSEPVDVARLAAQIRNMKDGSRW